MNKILLDSHVTYGKTFRSFKEAIEIEKERTKISKNTKSQDLEVYSYVNKDEEQYYFIELDPSNLYTENCESPENHMCAITKECILKAGAEYLFKEMENEMKILIRNKVTGELYYVSSNIMSTLYRFGLAGTALKKPSLARDTFLAQVFKDDKECTLVYKKHNGAKKLFSILSGKYTALDQGVIFDVIDHIGAESGLGKPVCYNWSISHFVTSVYIEFPEKAKELAKAYDLDEDFIPGIWIATSDTGDCSFKIRGTWRYKNGVTFFNEVKRRHIGEISIPEIITEAEAKIFAEYTKLPEALCSAMLVDITDPSWDLDSTEGMKLNESKLAMTMKHMSKELGLVKAIGKKNEKIIIEQLIDQMDPSIRYTGYDIACIFMSLPNSLSGLKNTEDLKKACYMAPYVDFNVKEKEEIILTA